MLCVNFFSLQSKEEDLLSPTARDSLALVSCLIGVQESETIRVLRRNYVPDFIDIIKQVQCWKMKAFTYKASMLLASSTLVL